MHIVHHATSLQLVVLKVESAAPPHVTMANTFGSGYLAHARIPSLGAHISQHYGETRGIPHTASHIPQLLITS